MKRRNYLCMAILIVITSCPAWADLYEYSDAGGGYGFARHVTGEWQRLGVLWDNESGQLTVDNDDSDDGVRWTTDGGSTYGGDLIRGQEVTFEFDMRRAPYGNHDYDQIKVWIDWDGDTVWHNEDEIILGEKWDKYDDDPDYNTR
jgi:hypothetical protein